MSSLSIALIHHPVYDKNRQVVATAVTNLDLHDIARAARTYGLLRYYVVTPVVEQQALANRIVGHWQEGWGAGYNPKRKEALSLVRIMPSLDEAVTDLARETGSTPRLVATGAAERTDTIGCADLAARLAADERPHLLLFGTGWGLTEEIFARADMVLEPIRGHDTYNHLSVRAAAAIIMDRLRGDRGRQG